MLGYAAWQDGRVDELKRTEIGNTYSASVAHSESTPKRENVQLHS